MTCLLQIVLQSIGIFEFKSFVLVSVASQCCLIMHNTSETEVADWIALLIQSIDGMVARSGNR